MHHAKKCGTEETRMHGWIQSCMVPKNDVGNTTDLGLIDVLLAQIFLDARNEIFRSLTLSCRFIATNISMLSSPPTTSPPVTYAGNLLRGGAVGAITQTHLPRMPVGLITQTHLPRAYGCTPCDSTRSDYNRGKHTQTQWAGSQQCTRCCVR